jgi:branched-chain amino acid aminotransferase
VELPKYAYFKGKIIPFSEAKVSILTHGLNYGTAVFGGLRGYWNADEKQLYLFRPLEHYRRFLNSAKLMCMEFDQTPESLTQITLDLLRADSYQTDVYVRPLAYKADEIIGVRLHNLQDEFSITALPFGHYVANDDNAHVTFSSWRRVDDNIIPARGKISGSYANSAFIKTDAQRAGFDEALVLNQDGHVSEGSAENFFMVKDGVLVTPSVTENILEGITRKTLLELAREELHIPVEERPVDRTEVYLADEVFLSGTAAQITVVTRVDFRTIGTGQIGPITAQLRRLYDQVARGQIARYRRWNFAVYELEKVK